jgi:hypothetical protein
VGDSARPRRACQGHPPCYLAPFGAAVGALVGILISVPLWVLIAVVVPLLRRR